MGSQPRRQLRWLTAMNTCPKCTRTRWSTPQHQTSQRHNSKEMYQPVTQWTCAEGSSTQLYGPILASTWTARHNEHLGYDGKSLARNWSRNFLNVTTVTIVLAHLVHVRQPHALHSPPALARGITENTHKTLWRFPTFQVATTCFSYSPPDLNLLVTNFVFCTHVK